MKNTPFIQVRNSLKSDLDKLTPLNYLIIKSWKKDRRILVSLKDNQFLIQEHGFERQELTFAHKEDCLKAIKKLINFEFPRSKKLWYGIGTKELFDNF